MRLLFAALVAVLLTGCDPNMRSWSPPARTVKPPARTAPVPARPSNPTPPAAQADAQPRHYYVPTPQEIESANDGAIPENYEQLVRDYMRSRLYQPDDARYRFSRGPRKAYRPGYTKQGTLFAWSVGAHINAKNAAGKYTGEDFHLFYVVNGRIVEHSNVDADLRRFTIGSR